MTRKTWTALAALCFVAVTAQERFDLKVRNYFFAGFAGDAESLAKGMQMSEDALAADPKNAEALVWHGSGLYFQSGQFFQKVDPEQGMALFNRGISEMDHAVELAPDSVGVRIPRGASLMTGSRFIPDPQIARPLVEKAVSDYEKALEVQSDNLDSMPTHPKGELLIGLAEGYARLGNAEKAKLYYARIEKDLPGTPYAKAAHKYLETGAVQHGCLGCHTSK